MSGERDLARLISGMSPVLREETYVLVSVPGDRIDDGRLLGSAAASIREAEGLTLVLELGLALDAGLSVDHEAAWITLEVHSALEAVGFTAAFAAALGDAGISCNVLAGFHHDHLLVPSERAGQAMEVLRDLARAGAKLDHSGGIGTA